MRMPFYEKNCADTTAIIYTFFSFSEGTVKNTKFHITRPVHLTPKVGYFEESLGNRGTGFHDILCMFFGEGDRQR